MNAALLLIALMAAGTSSECVVTDVGEVVTFKCGRVIVDIPMAEWPYPDPVIGERRDKHALHCEIESRLMIKNYCGGMYCRPPINSLKPDGC